MAEYAHNNTACEAYLASPAEICQGQIVNLNINHKTSNSTAVDQYLKKFKLSQNVFHDNLVMALYKQLKYAEKHRNPNITFKVGHLVIYIVDHNSAAVRATVCRDTPSKPLTKLSIWIFISHESDVYTKVVFRGQKSPPVLRFAM